MKLAVTTPQVSGEFRMDMHKNARLTVHCRALLAIAGQLGLSRATVARICQRAGLNRLAKLEPLAPVVRYERARPGELLHLDVKKLGRILRVGHRITG
jgi:hypothetical protein